MKQVAGMSSRLAGGVLMIYHRFTAKSKLDWPSNCWFRQTDTVIADGTQRSTVVREVHQAGEGSLGWEELDDRRLIKLQNHARTLSPASNRIWESVVQQKWFGNRENRHISAYWHS